MTRTPTTACAEATGASTVCPWGIQRRGQCPAAECHCGIQGLRSEALPRSPPPPVHPMSGLSCRLGAQATPLAPNRQMKRGVCLRCLQRRPERREPHPEAGPPLGARQRPSAEPADAPRRASGRGRSRGASPPPPSRPEAWTARLLVERPATDNTDPRPVSRWRREPPMPQKETREVQSSLGSCRP